MGPKSAEKRQQCACGHKDRTALCKRLRDAPS